MSRLLSWAFNAIVFTALGGFLVWVFVAREHERGEKGEADRGEAKSTATAPASAPARVERSADGETVITFDAETQKHIGIEVQPLAATTRHPEVVAFGALQEDPARSFTLKAPLPGIMQRANSRPWPKIGDRLDDGTVVGMIAPRLSPVERTDLASRLVTARADVEGAKVSVSATRASYESKKKLNAQNGIVSDLMLKETDAKLQGEEIKLKAAEETVHVIESSLNAVNGPAGPLPLKVVVGGQVVEVLAQPGEAIESGQAIVRVAKFDRLFAQVGLPAGERVPAEVATAQIAVLGHEDQPLEGQRLATAAMADARTGGASLLFAVAPKTADLRPGTALTAYLALPGEPRKGVVIPRSAIVRVASKTWVYVRKGEDKFRRQEIALEQAAPQGWFVTHGVADGDQVAIQGAQSLLSEEFSSQSGGGGGD